MTRPDYCPIGGQPCQSMCDRPCRARKPLTRAQIRALEVEVASGPKHQYSSDAEALTRAVERAHEIG